MRAISERRAASLVLVALACASLACDGRRGPAGPPGPPGGGSGGGGSSGGDDEPTDDELARGEAPPGVVVEILSVEGASGANGAFQVGDRITLEFAVRKADGAEWELAELDFGRVLVSGPTFNYQRVVPEQADLIAESARVANGVQRYTLADPIPAAYLAPYHDTDAHGPLEGELTGEPLLAGTYTVGISLGWRYTLAGEPAVDVGEASADFLFGTADVLAPREVVAAANCDQCHVELRAHGGERRELRQCLMCHTSGAEDLNDPSVGGGTPGVTIDSRVLFHRIHDAAHLPSVLGVGVHEDGTLDYERAPRPLVFADARGELVDYSQVGFPVWPNRTIPMLRDFLYSSLSPEARAKEDAILRGVTSCRVCHGDPDGDGPLGAPADGELVYTQPSRKACGACHDDVDWSLPYQTNAQIMPPQPDSSACKTCHEVEGGPLAVRDAHRHPLEDPAFDAGLVIAIAGAREAGAHDGDGTIDAGESVEVRFTLRDASGADVDPSEIDALELVLSGPTTNAQIVLRETLPPGVIGGAQPFALVLPERVHVEHVGDSTGGADAFVTSRAPHVDVEGARTVVLRRTGGGEHASALAEPAAARASSIVVADAAGFARDDWIVLDDGVDGAEEYLRIQLVEGERLWLSTLASPAYPPGTRHAHAAGAEVREVRLEELERGVDYALDPFTGAITELAEIGAGRAVLVSYTAPFRMPNTYPAPLHDSPDLGETSGEWMAKPIADGTYTVTLAARRTRTIQFALETNEYTIASRGATATLLVGGASEEEPYALIATGASCLACHQELLFHGGAHRGFDACIACHGTSGAEDRPRYVSAGAPETEGVTVSFRTLLHRIHMGTLLDQADEFVVVGESESEEPWPDDYSVSGFGTILFPAMPGGVLQCVKCHGASNDAWRAPAPRDHPLGQATHVRAWAAVCIGCHDSSAAQAHVDSQTAPSGAEGCAICHGEGEEWSVSLYHDPH